MTDLIAGFVVTLEQDLREDDADVVVAAIRQLRGVASVQPVQGGVNIAIATQRARYDIERRLYEALRQ